MNSLTEHQGQLFSFPAKINSLEKVTFCDEHFLKKAGATGGYVKAFILKNGIQFSCSEYKTGDDFHLDKLPSAHEFFILRIDEISDSDSNVVMVDAAYSNETGGKNFLVNLLSSSDKFTFFAAKGSRVKTAEIIILPGWFATYTGVEFSYDLLTSFLSLKTKTRPGFSNDSLKKIFLEIMNKTSNEDVGLDFIDKKISLLLSIAFSGLATDLHNFIECQKVKISRDEIKRLITVRKVLDTVWLPPTFASLTKIALMSSTSLKTKFKKMYGTTVFEYYQRIRMHKAKILLLTHKYSIKQIGRQLGYSNLSNFSIAFKKEFNQLPHELVK